MKTTDVANDSKYWSQYEVWLENQLERSENQFERQRLTAWLAQVRRNRERSTKRRLLELMSDNSEP